MNLEELIYKKFSRRNLLKGAALFTAASIIPYKAFGGQRDAINNINGTDAKVILSNSSQLNFSPIPPSDADAFVLPEGFDYTVIRKWGDMINDSEAYGINNDFTAYLPIDALQNGQNSEDGLLVVNHEFPSPLFCGGYTDEDLAKGVIKTQSQIDAERKSVGMSVFRVKKVNGKWEFINDNIYNRRIDANTPLQLNGKASGSKELDGATIAKGTLANCSGGVTLWKTVLSGEENFQDYPMKEVIAGLTKVKSLI
jgi:secreted PhoX family phosphatase